MIDININIKENIESIIKDRELFDYITEKIKNDPATVKKRLTFNFLYDKNNCIYIEREEVKELSERIYFIFINEVKRILYLKNIEND